MTKWKVRSRSILIVGEGRDDAAFLKHMKYLASGRGNSPSYQIRNAKGGSPIAVLDWAYTQSQQASYDEVWVLMDRDVIIRQMNSATVEAHAADLSIQLMLSIECLEEMLLRIKGITPLPPAIKSQLKTLLAGSADDPFNYRAAYDKSTLSAACTTEAAIGQLMQVFLL